MTSSFRRLLLLSLAAAALSFAGAAKADIKVGTSAPKTGPLAGGAAITHWPNVQLWVETINARGGLKLKDGMHKIQLIEYDDRTNPQEALKNYERLITQDKVDVLLAPYATGFNLALAPVFAKNGFPQLAATSVTDKTEELTKRYPGVFFMLGDTSTTVTSLVEVLAKMRDEKKIGNKLAMVNVADAFGIEAANVARPAFKKAGFELVYDKSYPLGTQDLAPVIKGAKAASADAFVAWSYPPDTFALTEQARVENLNVKAFYLGIATAFPGFAAQFKEFAEGTMGMGGVNADTPEMRAYVEQHKKVTGKVPDSYAGPVVYASFQILEQAVEAVGEIDKAKITDYIKNNAFKTVIGEVKFKDQISPNFWTVGQWQNGLFQGVAPTDRAGAKAANLKTNWK